MWVQNSVVMDDESALRDVSEDTGGRLHGEGEIITAAAEMELGQTWNQIARCGDFRGHKYPFSITRRTMEEMIQNFRETRNQHVQVDYEHASEQDPALLGDGGAPAVAWVRDLAVREGGEGPTLWALFDWVDPDAVQKVRRRQYKYLSPSLTMRSRHPETGVELGAKLWSVGLVNRPFIDGMAPVTASDSPDTGDAGPVGTGPVPECAGNAEDCSDAEQPRIRENSAVSFASTPTDSNTAGIQLDGNSAEGRFVPMDSDPSATPATAALTPGDVHVPTPEPKHNCANKFAKALCSALSAAPFNCAITLGDGVDYETAEADMIGKLQGLASEMGRLQQAEMKSLRAEATALVTLAAKSGAFVIDEGQEGDDAIETAVQLCLSNRKVFDGLYGARIAKFTAATSDAQEQYRVLASFRKPDVTNAAEVRRLLSQRVVAPSSDDEIKARSEVVSDPAAKSLASDRPDPSERNSRVFVRAQELAAASKVPLETAIRMAERELPPASR